MKVKNKEEDEGIIEKGMEKSRDMVRQVQQTLQAMD
jgi:hypothetical protein